MNFRARQAIETRWIAPTNFRGSRIKATAAAGSVTLHWDHALGIEENHGAAALALANKFNWPGEWHVGGLHKNGYVFVSADIGGPCFVTYRQDESKAA